jgi:hypothetical protein
MLDSQSIHLLPGSILLRLPRKATGQLGETVDFIKLAAKCKEMLQTSEFLTPAGFQGKNRFLWRAEAWLASPK